MKEMSKVRLNVALRELNVHLDRAVEFLSHKKIKLILDQLQRFLKIFINYF